MSEFDHDNPAVGEAEYIQLTKAVTGQVPAGVYFFVVKSLTPESNGKIQRGTFCGGWGICQVTGGRWVCAHRPSE